MEFVFDYTNWTDLMTLLVNNGVNLDNINITRQSHGKVFEAEWTRHDGLKVKFNDLHDSITIVFPEGG